MDEILEEHVKNVSSLSGTFDGLEMLKLDNPDSGKIFAGNMYIEALKELKKLRAERDDYKRQAELYHRDMMNVRAQRDKERAERDEIIEVLQKLNDAADQIMLHIDPSDTPDEPLNRMKEAQDNAAAVVAKHNSPRG